MTRLARLRLLAAATAIHATVAVPVMILWPHLILSTTVTANSIALMIALWWVHQHADP